MKKEQIKKLNEISLKKLEKKKLLLVQQVKVKVLQTSHTGVCSAPRFRRELQVGSVKLLFRIIKTIQSIIIRPCEAGAVLQAPLSLIH